MKALTTKSSKESFKDYKIRVIDPISPTFCAAKWANSTIWLNQGSTSSCHHPAHHAIDLSKLKANPSALHDTDEKIAARRDMLNGVQTPECGYCWAVENSDTTVISDRTYKTAMFSDEDIAKCVEDGPEKSILRTLEIAFDRTCNLACSYCSPTFSSTWVNDIKRNGPYLGLSTDHREHYKTAADWAQPFPVSNNPYVDAFWQWWPTLKTQLTELRITGGEPLLSKDTWKLLDQVANEKLDFRVAINSNLTLDDSTIDRLMKTSFSMERFVVFTSCESVGLQAEYIRDGLRYQDWQKNVLKLLYYGNLEMLNVMMTVNALCLYGITEFLDWILSVKQYHKRLQVSVNILRNPEFMSIDVLPPDERIRLTVVISKWWSVNRGSRLWYEHEREQIDRLISCLTQTFDSESLRQSMEKDFVEFYSQYDLRRGKSLQSSFPEIWIGK